MKEQADSVTRSRDTLRLLKLQEIIGALIMFLGVGISGIVLPYGRWFFIIGICHIAFGAGYLCATAVAKKSVSDDLNTGEIENRHE